MSPRQARARARGDAHKPWITNAKKKKKKTFFSFFFSFVHKEDDDDGIREGGTGVDSRLPPMICYPLLSSCMQEPGQASSWLPRARTHHGSLLDGWAGPISWALFVCFLARAVGGDGARSEIS